MSSRSRENTAPKGQTIALPTIPRMTDEKSRLKYLAEYDKFEPELLKHHLGPPENSNTIGLRDVPTVFDRTVPSLGEPTAAEREYEHQLRERDRRNRPRPLYEQSKLPMTRGVGSAAAAAAKSPALPRSLSTPAYSAAAMSAADTVVAASGTAATAATPVVTGAAADQSSPSSAASSSPPSRPSLSPRGLSSSTEPVMVSETAKTVAATAARDATRPGALTRTLGTVKTAPKLAPTTHTSPERTAPLSKRTASAGVARSATTRGTTRSPPQRSTLSSSYSAPAKSVRLLAPSPPRRAPPRALPHSAVLGATNTASSTATRREASPPTVRGSVTNRYGATQPVQRLNEAEIGAAFKSHAAATTTATHSFTTSRAETSTNSVQGCAELLRVLLKPPLDYAESLHLDLHGTDLRWITDSLGIPGRLTSLSHLPSTSMTGSGHGSSTSVTLNSPRSVLVLLRNGVCVDDIAGRSDHASDDQLPQDVQLQELVKKYRTERAAERREQLIVQLRDEYQGLCGQVPLQELVRAIRSPPHTPTVDASLMPSSLQQRVERQRRVFETNQTRLERQMELIRDVRARQLAAEERQELREEELRLAREAKTREEEVARQRQAERLAAQLERNREIEAIYIRQLQEKQAKADERNRERQLAMERQLAQRQEQRAALEEQRRLRFVHNALVLQEQAAALDERRAEKEAKLAKLREERLLRLQEEQAAFAERQAKTIAAREEAKRRAEEAEEQVRQAALARQRQVEDRLREFEERRQAEQLQRMAQEQAREERRQRALEQARAQEDTFRERTLENRTKHDALFEEARQRRLVELTVQKEREREEAVEKSLALRKKQRMEEFDKLHTVAGLIEKRRAADYVTQQREVILRETLKEREKLNLERELFRSQLQTATMV